jgi:hypothetical protein
MVLTQQHISFRTKYTSHGRLEVLQYRQDGRISWLHVDEGYTRLLASH